MHVDKPTNISMLLGANSPMLFFISHSQFPKRSLIKPMLPLKRMAYHIPESDKPQDFEIQGTWGGAGFLMGACIKYCAYLGAGEERGKKMPTPSPVPLEKKN